MVLAVIGVVIGLGAALWLTRFLSAVLCGVKPWDHAAFIATALLRSAVAFLAVSVPARRATRVNPMTALRSE